MRLDAHQHFWHYDPVAYDWIDDSMQQIAKDCLPEHLRPLLLQQQIDGCIAVQARQSIEENDFLLALAADNEFIKGIVGWVDFQSPDIAEQLQRSTAEPLLKGFRHVLQGEAPEFMLQPAFLRGIAALRDFSFVYDVLVFPHHLPTVIRFVQQFPDIPFVLDHIAKPLIGKGEITAWQQDITALSELPNISCKLSGMVTEGNWNDIRAENYAPYINYIVTAFGPERILFGSDWPVCEVAAPYPSVVDILEQNTKQLSTTEKDLLWGGNAARIYGVGS